MDHQRIEQEDQEDQEHQEHQEHQKHQEHQEHQEHQDSQVDQVDQGHQDQECHHHQGHQEDQECHQDQDHQEHHHDRDQEDHRNNQHLQDQHHHQNADEILQSPLPDIQIHGSLVPTNHDAGFHQEIWNRPRRNVYKTIAACWALLIVGANDGSIGALLPYLELYYGVNYTVVSLLFLTPVVGYAVSAFTVNRIHELFGQRGIAIIGPSIRLLAYVVVAQHPPYPLVVISFTLGGFGNGLEDASWNAWIGNMKNANQVLGFLHGAYGLGAAMGPLLATTLITKAQSPWWIFYFLLIGATTSELLTCTWAFWENDGERFHLENPRTTDETGGRTLAALKHRVTWICAAFLFVYVGIEVSLSGWVVTFMVKVRNASAFAAGMSTTGFWLGLTAGRLILGFVTPRIGEKLAALLYLALAMAMHLIFYLVPVLVVSFISLALEGFFLGPLFPLAVVAATKLLPKRLHVSAIGFATAMGAGGATCFPFAVGAIAQAKGVEVLMPIVLTFIIADGGIWLLLPSLKRGKQTVKESSG